MSEETKQAENTAKFGEVLATSARVAGKGTLFGLVWTAKQVASGAKATGRVFAEEWKRQKESR